MTGTRKEITEIAHLVSHAMKSPGRGRGWMGCPRIPVRGCWRPLHIYVENRRGAPRAHVRMEMEKSCVVFFFFFFFLSSFFFLINIYIRSGYSNTTFEAQAQCDRPPFFLSPSSQHCTGCPCHAVRVRRSVAHAYTHPGIVVVPCACSNLREKKTERNGKDCSTLLLCLACLPDCLPAR